MSKHQTLENTSTTHPLAILGLQAIAVVFWDVILGSYPVSNRSAGPRLPGARPEIDGQGPIRSGGVVPWFDHGYMNLHPCANVDSETHVRYAMYRSMDAYQRCMCRQAHSDASTSQVLLGGCQFQGRSTQVIDYQAFCDIRKAHCIGCEGIV